MQERRKVFLGLGGQTLGKMVVVKDQAAAAAITRKAQQQFNRQA